MSFTTSTTRFEKFPSHYIPADVENPDIFDKEWKVIVTTPLFVKLLFKDI